MVDILFNVLGDYRLYDSLLPAILIFLVLYSILTFSKIFGKNWGVNVLISLVISLMSVRFGLVELFYREIFPKFGTILITSIVLIIIIFIFVPIRHQRLALFLVGIGIAIAIFVAIFNSFDYLGWNYGIWDEFAGPIILIAIFLAIFFWVRLKYPHRIRA